jgi:PIN domain nuclease of toxin-antitoxin system
MLHQHERIQLVQPVEAWRPILVNHGLREWPLTGGVGIAAAMLVDCYPAPADRFVTATALLHGARLVTADDRILTCLGTLRASERGHSTRHP